MKTTTMTSSLTVLGKRKRVERISKDNLVLLLSGGSSSESEYVDGEGGHSNSEPEDTEIPRAGDNGEKKMKREKERKYRCEHEGCSKSYAKPSRLKEHKRSHTGERPYACSQCSKTYLRDTHLNAHMRVHLPASQRSFACSEDGCEKRFWTSQHLKVHEKVHRGELSFACKEPNCYEKFAKNHQLRTHFTLAHCPPGTKPYLCEAKGCGKSFTTNQKFRAHAKVHDEHRYTCVNPSCSSGTSTFFQTWSALQAHNRTYHPPTCPYESCEGRTFSATKNLRAHLKVHMEREVDDALDAAEADDEQEGRTKRRGGEVGRVWVCEEVGCEKGFKSKKALRTHKHITHLKRRDFLCRIRGCERTFGYKHLLKRHIEKDHNVDSSDDDSESEDSESGNGSGDEEEIYLEGEQIGEMESVPSKSNGLSIDFITGTAYSRLHPTICPSQSCSRSRAKKGSIQCPFPHLDGFPSLTTSGENSNLNNLSVSKSLGKGRGDKQKEVLPCKFVLSRSYDLWRHLCAFHGLNVERRLVDEWVRGKDGPVVSQR